MTQDATQAASELGDGTPPGGPRPAIYAGAFTEEHLQGDVYTGVRIVTGNWREETDQLGRKQGHYETLIRDDQVVVVVSHSCDTDSKHVNSRDDIQVALLTPLRRHDRDEVQRWTSGEDPNDPLTGKHIHEFFYDPIAELGGQDYYRIRFADLYIVKRGMLKRDKKVAELTPVARANLKGKLFLHFCRPEVGVPNLDPHLLERVLEPRTSPTAGAPPPMTGETGAPSSPP